MLGGRRSWASCAIVIFLSLFTQLYGQTREFNFYIERKDTLTFLQITSTQTFPCLGYQIRTFELWDNDTLIVDIRGFISPTPCYQGIEFAITKRQILGRLTKRFAVKFRSEGKIDMWIIDVKGDSFNAAPVLQLFTSWFRG